MIVLVLGNVAASRKMLALVRDCVATLESPAAYIDMVEGMRFDPVSAMKHEGGEAVSSRLVKLVALMWEEGARRLVIPLPASPPGQPGPDLAKLAFMLKRTASQPVYKLDVDQHLREKALGTWSPDALEISLRQLAKSLGPRQEIAPWQPTPPRIETDRLVLTWPTREQLDGYYAAIVGTDIFRNLLWEGPRSPEDMPDYWQARKQAAVRDPAGDLNMAVIEKGSGEMIGGISLRSQLKNGFGYAVWDLGYALAPRWHGRGYATEMVRAMVDAAFVDRKAERLFADAFVGNDASRRVLEKNGFVFEGVCRSVIGKPDGRRDEWKLALTRADWENRRR